MQINENLNGAPSILIDASKSRAQEVLLPKIINLPSPRTYQ